MRKVLINALKTYANPPALVGNLIDNPNDLTNASWNGGSNLTKTANSYRAPDGSTTASLLVPTSTSSANHFTSETPVGTTTAVPWLVRARFRPAGYNFAQITLANDASYTKFVFALLDIAGGRVVELSGTTYNSITRARVLRLADRWLLAELSITPDANTTHRVDIHPVPTGKNGLTYSGDTVAGAHAWGIEFAPAPN